MSSPVFLNESLRRRRRPLPAVEKVGHLSEEELVQNGEGEVEPHDWSAQHQRPDVFLGGGEQRFDCASPTPEPEDWFGWHGPETRETGVSPVSPNDGQKRLRLGGNRRWSRWRSGWDSNPRYPFGVRFFSKEVLSTTQPPNLNNLMLISDTPPCGGHGRKGCP